MGDDGKMTKQETEVLTDVKTVFPVLESREVWHGRVFSMQSERVQYGGGVAVREFVKHPGAVAIVPLREVASEYNPEGLPEVLLIDQYRHPVGATLWEIPAGLLDIPGEDPLVAAKRELAEEAELRAGSWDVLVDYFTTPGGSTESLRVFLARDLESIPLAEQTFVKQDEEAFMTRRWVGLHEALAGIFAGRIHNPSAVVGLLATQYALQASHELRKPEAPWLR